MCEYDEGPQKEFDQTKIHIGQAKSELGANRGPRAGSPRGVVVATSQRIHLKRLELTVWLQFFVSCALAGRYRSQF